MKSIVNKLSVTEKLQLMKKLEALSEKGRESILLNKVILVKKIYSGAKKVCLVCFTPIYESGGECPNCCN